MGGTKKDIVISNKIIDPTRPGYVVIYGWHQLNGAAIQPLTNIHSGSYVDYSHGVRLMNAELLVALEIYRKYGALDPFMSTSDDKRKVDTAYAKAKEQ